MVKVEIRGIKKYIQCKNCSSVLSFEREDELRGVDYCYIQCPICNFNVITKYEREPRVWETECKDKLSDFYPFGIKNEDLVEKGNN